MSTPRFSAGLIWIAPPALLLGRPYGIGRAAAFLHRFLELRLKAAGHLGNQSLIAAVPLPVSLPFNFYQAGLY